MKVRDDLVELLAVAVNAVLVGAEIFVKIELWADEKLDWLRKYLPFEHGIPAHDIFGLIFGLIDPDQFEAAFRRWVSSILPAMGAETVAIDGKTSRRSGGVDATALHLVSVFAAGTGLVLGQRTAREKSNQITAIPELLSTLPLGGCTVTIDAIDAQMQITESIRDFWRTFRAHPPDWTRHSFAETVEKDHGRFEIRRCFAFDQLECLLEPGQWRGLRSFAVLLRSFAVLETEREIGQIVQRETRLYISSLAPDAGHRAHIIRCHWSVENRLHWVTDVIFNGDQRRARSRYAAHNLAVLKHITLNLIRLDPIKRKGDIKARRLIAATSDIYRAQLLGLK